MKIPIRPNKNYWHQLVEAYTPFLYVSNGKLEFYTSYEILYTTTLQRMFYMFPRGYVDLVQFASYYCSIPQKELKIWEQHIRGFFLGTDFCLWPMKDYFTGKLTAENYMRALHELTGTRFSMASFNLAWVDFQTWLKDMEED